MKGVVPVTGLASGANFMKWQLDLLPGGNADQAAFLSLGVTPGVFTYTFDSSLVPAGQYALRLRVVKNDSNYDEYLNKITVAR